MTKPHTLAFSLVELSIVLVILGLLVGGVLSGQSLIRASELRAVSTEYELFHTATQSFRDKYSALPGDMPNATDFWGSAGGTGADAVCAVVVSTTAATCNGNGDGMVITNAATVHETQRFWQHLANAGLIEGRYTGYDAAGGAAVPQTNIPGSKMPSGGWVTNHNGVLTGDPAWFDADYGQSLSFYNRSSPTRYGILLPAEAWNIDTKMDDGKPYSGKLSATWSAADSQTATACTNAASSADFTATYNLSGTNKDCGLQFRLFGTQSD